LKKRLKTVAIVRIIQIIDSLEAGGSERMAINYANALAENRFFSLVATRKEGSLLSQLNTCRLSFKQEK
jgi:hypothetical protein